MLPIFVTIYILHELGPGIQPYIPSTHSSKSKPNTVVFISFSSSKLPASVNTPRNCCVGGSDGLPYAIIKLLLTGSCIISPRHLIPLGNGNSVVVLIVVVGIVGFATGGPPYCGGSGKSTNNKSNPAENNCVLPNKVGPLALKPLPKETPPVLTVLFNT